MFLRGLAQTCAQYIKGVGIATAKIAVDGGFGRGGRTPCARRFDAQVLPTRILSRFYKRWLFIDLPWTAASCDGLDVSATG